MGSSSSKINQNELFINLITKYRGQKLLKSFTPQELKRDEGRNDLTQFIKDISEPDQTISIAILRKCYESVLSPQDTSPLVKTKEELQEIGKENVVFVSVFGLYLLLSHSEQANIQIILHNVSLYVKHILGNDQERFALIRKLLCAPVIAAKGFPANCAMHTILDVDIISSHNNRDEPAGSSSSNTRLHFFINALLQIEEFKPFIEEAVHVKNANSDIPLTYLTKHFSWSDITPCKSSSSSADENVASSLTCPLQELMTELLANGARVNDADAAGNTALQFLCGAAAISTSGASGVMNSYHPSLNRTAASFSTVFRAHSVASGRLGSNTDNIRPLFHWIASKSSSSSSSSSASESHQRSLDAKMFSNILTQKQAHEQGACLTNAVGELLAAGASPLLRNREGQTPLFGACYFGLPQIVGLLCGKISEMGGSVADEVNVSAVDGASSPLSQIIDGAGHVGILLDLLHNRKVPPHLPPKLAQEKYHSFKHFVICKNSSDDQSSSFMIDRNTLDEIFSNSYYLEHHERPLKIRQATDSTTASSSQIDNHPPNPITDRKYWNTYDEVNAVGAEVVLMRGCPAKERNDRNAVITGNSSGIYAREIYRTPQEISSSSSAESFQPSLMSGCASADHNFVATAGNNGIAIRDLDGSGDCLCTFYPAPVSGKAVCLQWSVDSGQKLFVAWEGCMVSVTDMKNLNERIKQKQLNEDGVTSSERPPHMKTSSWSILSGNSYAGLGNTKITAMTHAGKRAELLVLALTSTGNQDSRIVIFELNTSFDYDICNTNENPFTKQILNHSTRFYPGVVRSICCPWSASSNQHLSFWYCFDSISRPASGTENKNGGKVTFIFSIECQYVKKTQRHDDSNDATSDSHQFSFRSYPTDLLGFRFSGSGGVLGQAINVTNMKIHGKYLIMGTSERKSTNDMFEAVVRCFEIKTNNDNHTLEAIGNAPVKLPYNLIGSKSHDAAEFVHFIEETRSIFVAGSRASGRVFFINCESGKILKEISNEKTGGTLVEKSIVGVDPVRKESLCGLAFGGRDSSILCVGVEGREKAVATDSSPSTKTKQSSDSSSSSRSVTTSIRMFSIRGKSIVKMEMCEAEVKHVEFNNGNKVQTDHHLVAKAVDVRGKEYELKY